MTPDVERLYDDDELWAIREEALDAYVRAARTPARTSIVAQLTMPRDAMIVRLADVLLTTGGELHRTSEHADFTAGGDAIAALAEQGTIPA